ncbi:hypothetical protein HMH01_00545 [Halovulum dunhuangense]|uniref:Uncharacterized protein n=1 Tax=Halovulum dunhuangense TaxID=1505036 RepID=A0A849KPE2_9RHOB|nr:hypothetical protein [Halovulum dunhuangense]NNU78913.1 hypothetical protein [Halovulum dunhuangense]
MNMSNEWMLDLLADIRNVAARNAMFELSEHLDDALLIAARELRSGICGTTGAGVGDALDDGLSGPARSHEFP